MSQLETRREERKQEHICTAGITAGSLGVLSETTPNGDLQMTEVTGPFCLQGSGDLPASPSQRPAFLSALIL